MADTPSNNNMVTAAQNAVIQLGSIYKALSALNPGIINASDVNGTTTNDNSAAGKLGEVIRSEIASGSAVSLTNATPANVTSILLTPGDWDVDAWVCLLPAGTTTASSILCSISQTSATLGNYLSSLIGLSVPAGQKTSLPCVTQRISISTGTTLYLVAQSNFAVSTMGAYGFIAARRAR